MTPLTPRMTNVLQMIPPMMGPPMDSPDSLYVFRTYKVTSRAEAQSVSRLCFSDNEIDNRARVTSFLRRLIGSRAKRPALRKKGTLNRIASFLAKKYVSLFIQTTIARFYSKR
jgi:hypothetical protein